jgi:hypothetical protein
VNYIKSSTPSSVGRDVKGIAKATYEAATEDPNAFIEDAIFSPLAAIRDFGDVRETARKLRAQGRNAEAEKMEAMAGTAVLSAVPIFGRPAGVATRKAIKAAEKSAVKGATKAAEMAVTPKAKPPSLLSAVRVGGKTYTGPTHLDALNAIPDPKVRSQASLDANSRGFVNERGKYMDRFKAADYARNFDLFSPDAPDWAKTAPEVISENLRLPELAVKAETPKVAPVVKSIETPSEPTGIIAYHGSPHSFDRFDISKIGTGEGAQAYGHGLYFAENEGVAKKYRDDLSGRVKSSADRLLTKNESIDAAINEAQSEIDRLMSLPNGGGDVFRRDGLVAIKKAAIDELAARKSGGGVGSGSMYQVRINANPEDFIDWDALLSNQNPKVKELFGESDLLAAADRLSLASRNPMFAGDIIKTDRATPSELSQALAKMGIPGIRYKDAGTRGMENPTRNYVVFDDALINLLRKYAIGGSVAA